jgi:hypothetical protein
MYEVPEGTSEDRRVVEAMKLSSTPLGKISVGMQIAQELNREPVNYERA